MMFNDLKARKASENEAGGTLKRIPSFWSISEDGAKYRVVSRSTVCYHFYCALFINNPHSEMSHQDIILISIRVTNYLNILLSPAF
jgi:hypothetical protein